MTSEQIDNIKRQQQESDCLKQTENLTRPIVIPHEGTACIYATERSLDGCEYGIILCDERYEQALNEFRNLVMAERSIDAMMEILSPYRMSLWSINSHIDIRIGPGFCAFWGETDRNLFGIRRRDRGSIHLERGQAAFFIVTAFPSAAEMTELFFQSMIAIDRPDETPFQFSEFLRFHYLERKSEAESVTAGVYVDVSSFQSVHLHRLSSEQEVNDRMKQVVQGLGEGYDEFSVKLVLVELVANAFRHGNARNRSGKVLLRIAESKEAIFIEASDLRRGTESIQPRQDVPFQDESGRGLYLVSAYSDRLFVDGCSSTAMIEKKKPNNREGK
ncbi:MAG: ATP-binding protein [Bacillota bacterium]|nr:ATP-binding protein [Bacillota bacterium]